MNLGAGLRRSSISRARVTGLLSTTALLCVAIGSLGAGVATATAPYPPTPPCSLSWSQNGAHRSVLVGSGYDTNQSVAVMLYPQARSLGSYPTNSSGAFAATIDVSQSKARSWVTASSVNRSCSVVPPPGTTPTPTGAPSSGGSTANPGGGTSSAGGGGTNGSGTSSAGGSGTNSSGTNSSGGGSTGGGSDGGGSTGGGINGGGPAASSSNSAPGRGQGSSGAGSGTSSTAPASSAVPSQPGTGSPSEPIDALNNPSALGLPLAVVIIIAVILLLAGGLGVLILTRRSG